MPKYTDNSELTQEGIHEIFNRMGYNDITSGSIYNGEVTINQEALGNQGFMPILTGVGPQRNSGHWIMLIKGRDNNYHIFDPLGKSSGASYQSWIASQLPPGARLSVIPNQAGLNMGLCGYWVASAGMRAHTALNGDAPNLETVGQTISEQMANELSGNGYQQITGWLDAVTDGFPGDAPSDPIDATDLRHATEKDIVPPVSVPVISPKSSSTNVKEVTAVTLPEWNDFSLYTDGAVKSALEYSNKNYLGTPYTGPVEATPVTIGGITIYRQHHGLAHTMRTMAYAQVIVEEARKAMMRGEKLQTFKDGRTMADVTPNELQKIMIAQAFFVAGRDDEESAKNYARYHEQSREAFKKYVRENESDLIPHIFKDQKDVDFYAKVIEDKNHDWDSTPAHVLVNQGHMVDLMRLKQPPESVFERYFSSMQSWIGTIATEAVFAKQREFFHATHEIVSGFDSNNNEEHLVLSGHMRYVLDNKGNPILDEKNQIKFFHPDYQLKKGEKFTFTEKPRNLGRYVINEQGEPIRRGGANGPLEFFPITYKPQEGERFMKVAEYMKLPEVKARFPGHDKNLEGGLPGLNILQYDQHLNSRERALCETNVDYCLKQLETADLPVIKGFDNRVKQIFQQSPNESRRVAIANKTDAEEQKKIVSEKATADEKAAAIIIQQILENPESIQDDQVMLHGQRLDESFFRSLLANCDMDIVGDLLNDKDIENVNKLMTHEREKKTTFHSTDKEKSVPVEIGEKWDSLRGNSPNDEYALVEMFRDDPWYYTRVNAIAQNRDEGSSFKEVVITTLLTPLTSKSMKVFDQKPKLAYEKEAAEIIQQILANPESIQDDQVMLNGKPLKESYFRSLLAKCNMDIVGDLLNDEDMKNVNKLMIHEREKKTTFHSMDKNNPVTVEIGEQWVSLRGKHSNEEGALKEMYNEQWYTRINAITYGWDGTSSSFKEVVLSFLLQPLTSKSMKDLEPDNALYRGLNFDYDFVNTLVNQAKSTIAGLENNEKTHSKGLFNPYSYEKDFTLIKNNNFNKLFSNTNISTSGSLAAAKKFGDGTIIFKVLDPNGVLAKPKEVGRHGLESESEFSFYLPDDVALIATDIVLDDERALTGNERHIITLTAIQSPDFKAKIEEGYATEPLMEIESAKTERIIEEYGNNIPQNSIHNLEELMDDPENGLRTYLDGEISEDQEYFLLSTVMPALELCHNALYGLDQDFFDGLDKEDSLERRQAYLEKLEKAVNILPSNEDWDINFPEEETSFKDRVAQFKSEMEMRIELEKTIINNQKQQIELLEDLKNSEPAVYVTEETKVQQRFEKLFDNTRKMITGVENEELKSLAAYRNQGSQLDIIYNDLNLLKDEKNKLNAKSPAPVDMSDIETLAQRVDAIVQRRFETFHERTTVKIADLEKKKPNNLNEFQDQDRQLGIIYNYLKLLKAEKNRLNSKSPDPVDMSDIKKLEEKVDSIAQKSVDRLIKNCQATLNKKTTSLATYDEHKKDMSRKIELLDSIGKKLSYSESDLKKIEALKQSFTNIYPAMRDLKQKQEAFIMLIVKLSNTQKQAVEEKRNNMTKLAGFKYSKTKEYKYTRGLNNFLSKNMGNIGIIITEISKNVTESNLAIELGISADKAKMIKETCGELAEESNNIEILENKSKSVDETLSKLLNIDPDIKPVPPQDRINRSRLKKTINQSGADESWKAFLNTCLDMVEHIPAETAFMRRTLATAFRSERVNRIVNVDPNNREMMMNAVASVLTAMCQPHGNIKQFGQTSAMEQFIEKFNSNEITDDVREIIYEIVGEKDHNISLTIEHFTNKENEIMEKNEIALREEQDMSNMIDPN